MAQRSWTTADIAPLAGRTMVITGANSGLGLAATKLLAGAGARVVMACRSLERAEAAAHQVWTAHPRADVEVRELDLASLASIRRFADGLATDEVAVDVLLNNAGVMALDRSVTEDGFEMHFGVNHLGHFALTGLLLHAMAHRPGARIVNVSSVAHRAGHVALDDPMYERRRYHRWDAYAQSKLASLLFTVELDRRLRAAGSSTMALAAHPGTSRTEVGKTGTSVANRVIRAAFPLVPRSAAAGARSIVRACLDPEATGGDYYGPRWWLAGTPVPETPSRQARRPEDARALWELSERLTGVVYPS